MADALEMVAQGMRLRSGADHEHVTRAYPAVVAVIEEEADKPAAAS